MLELDAPIHRDQRIVLTAHAPQKLAVPHPATSYDGVDTVAFKRGGEVEGSCSSRRTRTSEERSASEIERRNRLVAAHRRELTKELVEGLAAFEVVEQ